MIKKIATAMYVAWQAVAFMSALIVLSTDIKVSMSVRTVATFVVVLYVLWSAGPRLAMACIVRDPFSKETGVTQA